ncbi:MAG: hypothetical protein ACHQ4G_09460 [Opitutales bacterium]
MKYIQNRSILAGIAAAPVLIFLSLSSPIGLELVAGFATSVMLVALVSREYRRSYPRLVSR